MKDVWVVMDGYEIDRYRTKFGMDAAEAAVRRQLIKKGFDLRHGIEITYGYQGNPRYVLYEQTKEIIDAVEALKYHKQQKELSQRRN